jgi:Ser/Thr protein kinase RdoA (MazF antagonist)
MVNLDFQSRTNYTGDLNDLLPKICKDFDIGNFVKCQVIPMGYEDFNAILHTSTGKYLLKIFGNFRDDNECKRYVEVMEKVLKAGVFHPKLLKSNQGNLYSFAQDNNKLKMCVMQYIDGKTYYDLGDNPTEDESVWVIKQVALINQINLKPKFIYDSWAISNFSKEFAEKGKYLSKDDAKIINTLANHFEKLDINNLPHCFVHGDITKTNTMRDNGGQPYIIDFAVANWYPRIQELAVLFCDLFFNPTKPKEFPENYKKLLNNYQQQISLTTFELETLPLYVQMAHIMHLLRANFEKIVNNNQTKENEYFLNIGRTGLKFTTDLWGI